MVVLGLAGLTASSSVAREPPRTAPAAASLPAGFDRHLQPIEGGRIDWTNGYILAEGIGHPNGRESSEDQRRSMATRAAEIVAARNALAISQGIHVNTSRRVADLAGGRVRIEGVIRGHRIVRSDWEPNADPPTARVVLEVPLWGVRGVATIFARSERSRAEQVGGGKRLGLNAAEADVSGVVVVIDARGRDVSPCLFPVIVDADGRTLCDVGTLLPETVPRAPAVRYVETRLSFEQLRSAMGSRFEAGWFDVLAQDAPGLPGVRRTAATSPARELTSKTRPSRRRANQQFVIKAVNAAPAQARQVLISREDAERLRNSAEASGAMRRGQVLIVVDASDAGPDGAAAPVPPRP
jgi:hypothetical protein